MSVYQLHIDEEVKLGLFVATAAIEVPESWIVLFVHLLIQLS